MKIVLRTGASLGITINTCNEPEKNVTQTAIPKGLIVENREKIAMINKVFVFYRVLN